MAIGQFPGLQDFRRRTIRAPENPLDKCTIISIYPREIDETHHTIQPGRFVISAGSYDKPSLLVVGSSSWWKELDDESPLLEIPTSSIQIADAVVKCYCNGLLACDMAGKMPGLFFVPGKINLSDLLTKHKDLIESAKLKQNNWYRELILMADSLWSGSQGNPLAISDDMRLAARELHQNTKEWLADFQITESVRCVACGHMRNPLFPMCPNCKTIIDTKKYSDMNLKQAQ